MVHLYDALHGSQSRGTLDARRISKISAEQDWDKPAVLSKRGLETASSDAKGEWGETWQRWDFCKERGVGLM